MRENLRRNCIPTEMLNGDILDYDVFLEKRRKLMAEKLREYFNTL